jgi:hypothetical protein
MILCQNFGEFASAIYLRNCSSNTFYNTTGTDANCINPTCAIVFNGTNYGSFNQNSGAFSIKGGEIKTWKNTSPGNNGNVCSARLNYIVYPTGSRPATPSFTAITLPFKCGCNSGTFADGLGPCGGNDQKWNEESQNVDLTSRTPGDYTLEIYYDYVGDDKSTTLCRDTKYIDNGGNPTNYTATFSIVSSGGSCALLPITLSHFIANCSNENALITWSTESEYRNDYFLLERTTDGVNHETISKIYSNGNSNTEQNYAFLDKNYIPSSIYRLVQVDFDEKKTSYGPISVECYDTNASYFEVFPNPAIGANFEIFLQEKNRKGLCSLKMYDLKGSLVYFEEIQVNSGLNKYSVNKNLAQGIYFLEIDNQGGYRKTKKISVNC